MDNSKFFPFDNLHIVKQQILNFAAHFDCVSIYDSNELKSALNYGRYEILGGFGCARQFNGNFNDISHAIDTSHQWIMLYMAYETHTKFNSLESLNAEDAMFYAPEIVIALPHNDHTLQLINNGIDEQRFQLLADLFQTAGTAVEPYTGQYPQFNPCVEKGAYIKNVNSIKEQIIEGDFYEMNYCQKFIWQGHLTNAVSLFNTINTQSPAPFASFFKTPNYHIICTSPERFLYKSGDCLISQPIKGTNKRLPGETNKMQILALRNSEKEKAENVMIVDLVRNDLAKVCKTGSIQVEELFGIYPFTHVNQMISSIKGELNKVMGFADIFKALFPMGSMTGAPKQEVITNIAAYENTARGLYSGCIGYIMPNGDFDFNVVIRTIVEDIAGHETSLSVGGAITYDSDAEAEYNECLLKAGGLMKLMPGQ
ncbi:MAG: anthranilate synthase component I family protein [Bacteroidota bacterium]